MRCEDEKPIDARDHAARKCPSDDRLPRNAFCVQSYRDMQVKIRAWEILHGLSCQGAVVRS